MTEVIDRGNGEVRDGIPFTVTPTTQQIWDAVSECIRSRHVKLGWIIGPPGIGKTTALRAFVDRTPGSMMVTMSTAHSTLKSSLGYICRQLGREPPRGAYNTFEELVELLSGFGIRALIVDEAQESYTGLSNALRQVSDQIGLAVIFCGNPKYLTNFGKEKEAFAQITSRLAVNLRLGKPHITDVATICDLLAVEDTGARNALFKHSQSHGGIRIVHTLVQKATILAGDPAAIRVSHIRDALAVIGGAL